MNDIRCIVIGTGHLGKIHAGLVRGLHSSGRGLSLAGVVDSDSHRASAVADLFGVPAAGTAEELSDRFDAAIVATPTCSHTQIARSLLAAGKHCFVEKPLASDMLQCRKLIAAAEENNVTLQVGHVENFNPVFKGLRDQLTDIQYIDAVRCGTYTGRSTDIGIVMDLMIHDLDLIAELVDSPVQRVSAFGLNVLSQHEDFATAHLQFRSGARASVRASRIDEGLQRTFTVYCKHLIARMDLANGTATISRVAGDHASSFADALPYEQRLQVKTELFSRWMPTEEVSFAAENAIEQELLDFAAAIRLGCSPAVDGRRGLRAVTMAEQVLAAIDDARSRVAADASERDDRILRFPFAQPARLRSAA